MSSALLSLPMNVKIHLCVLCCPCPAQGVSSAGNQLGMKDTRSRLVSELFRVFDEMPRGFTPQLLDVQGSFQH